jgi:hypothetical protein
MLPPYSPRAGPRAAFLTSHSQRVTFTILCGAMLDQREQDQQFNWGQILVGMIYGQPELAHVVRRPMGPKAFVAFMKRVAETNVA